MVAKIILLLVCLFSISNARPSTSKYLHPDVGLTPKMVIEKYGYPLEVHTIETEDGYILETYRIPHGVNNASTGSREPVLFVPGVLCTAADYLTLGPGLSLPYILADEGYDVWLANYRGTTFSKKHKTLDPVKDEKQFFDFSFQEIGLYDVTANIDYILDVTNKAKLFYIGHSQGTTSFFAMASAKPEYNSKIKLMTALAPVTNAHHISHILFPFFKDHLEELQELSEKFGVYEVLPYLPLLTLYGQILCNDEAITQPICAAVFYFIAGFSVNFNQTVMPVVTSNTPAGGSARMFFHFAQLGRSENFEMYNFGAAENLKRYGQLTPPLLDVGKITAPVALFYANRDSLSNDDDVELLATMLPNVAKKHFIKGYNHLDYLWAKNVVPELHDHIVETMKLYT